MLLVKGNVEKTNKITGYGLIRFIMETGSIVNLHGEVNCQWIKNRIG